MAGKPKVEVELTGNAQGLFQALDKSTAQVKDFARGIEAHTKGIGRMVENLKAPFLALAGLVGGAAFLKSTVEETKNWTMEAQKLSKTLGITTEEASVLNLAIGDIYGSMDEFLPIVGKVTKTLNSNEDAFKKLGVATRDGNGNLRSTPAIIADVNTKLLAMKSGTDRNIASMQIYGKGWMEVQRYLGLTTEVMEAAQEKAQKLNLIVGSDSVVATNAYRASMNDLEDTVKGLKIKIGSELMPVLTAFNNDLAENGPAAVEVLSGAFQGLYQVVYALREQMEKGLTTFTYGLGEMVDSAAYAWEQAKAISRGNLREAAFNKAQFQAQEVIKAQAYFDALAEIEEKYTAKTMALMGIGPAGKGKGGPAAGGHATTAGQSEKAKANVFTEELAKLDQERAKVGAALNAQAKREAEWRKIQADHEERLAKWMKEVKAGSLDPKQARELALQSQALADEQEKALRAKSAQEEDAFNQQLYETRREQEQAHQLALLDLDKVDIEARRDMNQISASEALRQLEALEEQRYAIEKKGLEERLELQNLEIQERAKIVSQLQALEDKRTTGRQQAGVRIGMARRDESAQNTVGGGLQSYQAETLRSLQQWGNQAREIMAGVENAFADGIRGVLSGQMTLGQGLKAVWTGIANTFVSSMAKIVAQKITAWMTDKVISAWQTADTAKKIGENTAKSQSDLVAAGSATVDASANIFKAHSDLKWVGVAVAAAMVLAMLSSMANVKAQATARRVGGRVDKPEYTWLGEDGPEIVAPEASFLDYVRGISLTTANLQANLDHRQQQAYSYDAQAAGYARASAAEPRRSQDGATIHIHMDGATILDSSQRGMRRLGEMVIDGARAKAQEVGVVLRPGQVFGEA